MSQSKTDPNEFINKQLEMLKGLNNKELNSMKETLSQKINRIAALEEKITDLQDLLSKKDQDLLHKSKEQELTIRELELNVKILEEDQERIKSENTILAEELRRSDAEILDHTHLKQSMSVTRGMENNEDLFYLQDKMNATIHQNNEAKNAIFRLKSKVKKLKSTLHKAESIHAHNITLLQTQFDKEHNKWEKERVNYQQEIHTVKRKVIDLTHVLQKYQHNEVLFNTSCISWAFSGTSNFSHRVPLSVINTWNECVRTHQCCTCGVQNTTNWNSCLNCSRRQNPEYFGLNELKIKQCLRKSHMGLSTDRSDSEYLNPLLTQDSRKQSSKLFSTYCENSKKNRTSSAIRKEPNFGDTHSMILEGNEGFDVSSNSEPETPVLNKHYRNDNTLQYHYLAEDISDNNPMWDLESQPKSSFETKSRNKAMTQSKSFNNLLKNSRLKLIPEEEGDQLQTHFEEFNKKRKESMVKELELERINNLKPQNKYMGVSHYSSIHKCKPNCQECITTNVLKNTGRFQTMDAEEHYENYTSNKSSSSCERIETVTNGFATYSNISAVPNHAEDYAYSSVDEMANIIMNNKGNHEVKPNKAKKRQSRYNDSFGVNEFHLDTSPDSYLFNEGCYTRPTPKLSQNHTKMISEIKRTHGSKSTKNLHVNSFLNPKKTVSINLFGNESDEDIHKSGISEKSNSRVNIEGSQNYHNSSKFSTLKKPIKFAKPQKSSNNVSLAKKNKFFQRKSTLEASPNMTAFTKQLQEAEKQAQKAEKKLSCANRKASQEMSEVKNKIQTLKDQFIQHRKDNYTSKVKKSQTPTGLMNQNKSRSRMKYLQSKSRNNKSHLSDSKTSDLRSRRNTYKPFSSKMIQNFNKTTLTKSRPSTKRMSSSKNSSYLDTLYKKTRKKLVSTLKDRNSVESITTDKTIRRNENKLTDSTNNLSSSSQEDHYPTVKHRNELMYIQEEQEYTESQSNFLPNGVLDPTNEADLILESSCHWDLEEDTQKNTLAEETSDRDNEVLISSPREQQLAMKYKKSKFMYS